MGMEAGMKPGVQEGNDAMEAAKAENPEPVVEITDYDTPALGAEKVLGGVANGRTFADLYKDDLDFCKMMVGHVLQSNERDSPHWPFVAYILHRQLKEAAAAH